MAGIALVASVVAVLISLVALWFTYRADQRGERELDLTERQDQRQADEAVERRRGRPVITPRGGSGGPTADRVRHEYEVRNAGQAAITSLELWIVDENGVAVSTRAGGLMVLAPNDAPVHAGVDVPQPRPAEQKLMVRWRDSDGEREEWTGIAPPLSM